jgi:hypothetical protein
LNRPFAAYDAAWNLQQRTNNSLVQAFNVNSLNELTVETNRGTLTVAGTATEPLGGKNTDGFSRSLQKVSPVFSIPVFAGTGGCINTESVKY